MKKLTHRMLLILSFVLLFTGSLTASAKTYKKKIQMTVGTACQLSVQTTQKVSGWKSSDKKIVTVDKNGLAMPIKKGSAKISAKFGNNKAVFNVKVKQAETKVTSLSKTLYAGQTLTITVNTTRAVSYRSSDTSIAAVNNKGLVSAVSSGKCTITVRYGSHMVLYNLTLKDEVKPTKLQLEPEQVILQPGQSQTLTATVYPRKKASQSVTWKSSNKKVATVSADGVVTAVKKGITTITCSPKASKKVKASCKVTVTNTLTGLKVTTKLKSFKKSYSYSEDRVSKDFKVYLVDSDGDTYRTSGYSFEAYPGGDLAKEAYIVFTFTDPVSGNTLYKEKTLPRADYSPIKSLYIHPDDIPEKIDYEHSFNRKDFRVYAVRENGKKVKVTGYSIKATYTTKLCTIKFTYEDSISGKRFYKTITIPVRKSTIPTLKGIASVTSRISKAEYNYEFSLSDFIVKYKLSNGKTVTAKASGDEYSGYKIKCTYDKKKVAFKCVITTTKGKYSKTIYVDSTELPTKYTTTYTATLKQQYVNVNETYDKSNITLEALTHYEDGTADKYEIITDFTTDFKEQSETGDYTFRVYVDGIAVATVVLPVVDPDARTLIRIDADSNYFDENRNADGTFLLLTGEKPKKSNFTVQAVYKEKGKEIKETITDYTMTTSLATTHMGISTVTLTYGTAKAVFYITTYEGTYLASASAHFDYVNLNEQPGHPQGEPGLKSGESFSKSGLHITGTLYNGQSFETTSEYTSDYKVINSAPSIIEKTVTITCRGRSFTMDIIVFDDFIRGLSKQGKAEGLPQPANESSLPDEEVELLMAEDVLSPTITVEAGPEETELETEAQEDGQAAETESEVVQAAEDETDQSAETAVESESETIEPQSESEISETAETQSPDETAEDAQAAETTETVQTEKASEETTEAAQTETAAETAAAFEETTEAAQTEKVSEETSEAAQTETAAETAAISEETTEAAQTETAAETAKTSEETTEAAQTETAEETEKVSEETIEAAQTETAAETAETVEEMTEASNSEEEDAQNPETEKSKKKKSSEENTEE